MRVLKTVSVFALLLALGQNYFIVHSIANEISSLFSFLFLAVSQSFFKPLAVLIWTGRFVGVDMKLSLPLGVVEVFGFNFPMQAISEWPVSQSAL